MLGAVTTSMFLLHLEIFESMSPAAFEKHRKANPGLLSANQLTALKRKHVTPMGLQRQALDLLINKVRLQTSSTREEYGNIHLCGGCHDEMVGLAGVTGGRQGLVISGMSEAIKPEMTERIEAERRNVRMRQGRGSDYDAAVREAKLRQLLGSSTSLSAHRLCT
jgi:hypothetical protein